MTISDSDLQYLFNLPLFFQVVLLDSATAAGGRLAIPSLATPIGGLIAGVVMSRWGKLLSLVRLGALLMVVGNALVTSLGFEDSAWKYYVYIFPANLGQGIVYPGILFTSLATFDHAGEEDQTWKSREEQTTDTHLATSRPRRLGVDSLPHPVPRDRVRGGPHLCHCANHAQRPAPGCFGRDTRQMDSTPLFFVQRCGA